MFRTDRTRCSLSSAAPLPVSAIDLPAGCERIRIGIGGAQIKALEILVIRGVDPGSAGSYADIERTRLSTDINSKTGRISAARCTCNGIRQVPSPLAKVPALSVAVRPVTPVEVTTWPLCNAPLPPEYGILALAPIAL